MSLTVRLTFDQRASVETLRRDASLSPRDRDRVEIILLADSGVRVAAIAAHMDCCLATVRRVIHRFAREDLVALRRRRTGPPPDVARHAVLQDAIRARLHATTRVWSSTQLAVALRADGLAISPRHLRRYLRAMGASYKRIARSVRHKQDARRVAAARETLSVLKKRPMLVG